MLSLKNLFKKAKTEAKPTSFDSIDFLKIKYKKEQQKRRKLQERKQRLKFYIKMAGFDISMQKLSKTFFNIAIVVNLAISSFLIYYFSVTYGITWSTVVATMIVLWVLVFILLIIGLWVIFYMAVDLKIFKRKVDIEEVLPDFLQLTASNINAGMTIDKALWYAVRPRFGVLAKEIETVAKETMGGADLKLALERFADRYDSLILKRAISMINEGVEAGGEIGELLNRVALDIQEQKALMKEMSANVTTYVIFITFATVVAAPILFALSGILIDVVENLGSALGSVTSVAATSGIPISFSGTGVTQTDFKIFAVVSLILTSLFSAMMTSTIKKGNVKAGIRYIPIFITISVVLYFIGQSIGGRMLSIFV